VNEVTYRSEALDSEALNVAEWENELVRDTKDCLKDAAEIEEETVEAEAAIFVGKLLLVVTDGDWKQAEGIAAVVEDYFREQTGSNEDEPEEVEELDEDGEASNEEEEENEVIVE
jgi:hypothetical protein